MKTTVLTHLVGRAEFDEALERPVPIIKALCGEHCFLVEEGYTVPPDFDFAVLPDWRHVADCAPCLEIAAERRKSWEDEEAFTSRRGEDAGLREEAFEKFRVEFVR